MSHSHLVRIHPNEFVHILNLNTNVVHLMLGPQTLMLQTHENLVCGPCPCIIIPPGYYCIINDPARNYNPEAYSEERLELDLGQTKVLFHGLPYPLYPGESVEGAAKFGKDSTDYKSGLKPLPVVKANYAIRLRAQQDIQLDGVSRTAGDQWQLKGPLTYHPCPGVEIVSLIKPVIIKPNQVLKLKAIEDTKDESGQSRVTGEEWLVKKPGAYLPNVFEEVVFVNDITVLTPEMGLYLRATQTVTDLTGKKRLAGEEWLITNEDCSEYSSQVGVEIIKTVKKTVLTKGQYVVVKDPVGTDGKPQLGEKVLKVGLCSFFLHPGESFETNKVLNSHLLSDEESMVLQAVKSFLDSSVEGEPVKRKPGDRWLIKGPVNYIPPVEVTILKMRKKVPLSKNEGIYIQDSVTGKVRLIMGPCAYMLTATEELWEKPLNNETEQLLSKGGGLGVGTIRKIAYFEQSIDPTLAKGRDKTKVVTYRCPSNTAVQVNNYQDKKARVIFGPDLVVLGPHENFNVLSLSAGKPKKANELKSLCLMLGPDFISDIIEVETADHARLRMQISFNNYFEVDKSNQKMAAQLFAVPDFIGFACKRLGSQIRASVALTSFDEFHRHSARIIQSAVFGEESLKTGKCFLKFEVNNLVISGIDIESVEPVDTKMRDSLSKSVQLAIEISTSSIEAAAKHEANRAEQQAKGQLERQILLTEKDSERERTKLNELRAIAAAVESTGQAKAEAQAQAERALIECQSEIDAAKLISEAVRIEHEATLTTKNKLRFSELDYLKKKNEIEIIKEKTLAHIEVNKMSEMVSTIGADTLVAMSNAGPSNQLKLLEGLGLGSVLLTDGKSPINLLTTAQGLVAQPEK